MAYQKPYKKIEGGFYGRHYHLNPKRWGGRNITLYAECVYDPDYKYVERLFGEGVYACEIFISIEYPTSREHAGVCRFGKEELTSEQLDKVLDDCVRQLTCDWTFPSTIRNYEYNLGLVDKSDEDTDTDDDDNDGDGDGIFKIYDFDDEDIEDENDDMDSPQK